MAAENADPNERKRRLELRRAASSTRGFSFDPPTEKELEPPRTVCLQVDPEMGPGLELRATWYGLVIDDIDDTPGQPELQALDCIISVMGDSLQKMVDECEMAFAEVLEDGIEVEVEPHIVVSGVVPSGVTVDWSTLEMDLSNFGNDYEVELKVSNDKRELILSGTRSAVVAARSDALG